MNRRNNHKIGCGKELFMQAKTAIVKEEVLEPSVETSLMIPFETLFERISELFNQIENRAYQFFEESGRTFGYDLDNWLRAESELVMKVPVDMMDETSQLLVKATIPDFKEQEIKVNVQPARLTICGKHETKATENKTTTSESKELFCSIALPCEVKPETAKAEFKDGLLTITLPKLAVPEE
jgi:HSP20 family protein